MIWFTNLTTRGFLIVGVDDVGLVPQVRVVEVELAVLQDLLERVGPHAVEFLDGAQHLGARRQVPADGHRHHPRGGLAGQEIKGIITGNVDRGVPVRRRFTLRTFRLIDGLLE